MSSDTPPVRAPEAGQQPPALWRPPSLPFLPAALPPLPPIPDPVIAIRARTHKGSLTQTGANKRDGRPIELASNEVLEWKGDAALYWLTSTALSAALPTATCGELSLSISSTRLETVRPYPDTFSCAQDLRMRLTSNRTFAHLAWHYGLLNTLITRKNHLNERTTAEEEQRTAANAFEAHVGGLIEAHHGDTGPVSDYLRELLQPSVFPAFAHIKRTLEASSSSDNPAPRNKRPRLETGDPVLDAENLTGSGRRAVTRFRYHEWIDEFAEPLRWTSTLKIGDQVAGVGSAGKIAAARAAALDEYLHTVLPATTSA